MSDRFVVDASALSDYLIGTARGETVAALISGCQTLDAPHLIITETLSVLRGWSLGGKVDQRRLDIARHDLGEFPLELWDVMALGDRVWTLRHNLTAYDATYIALAEALGATLFTTDAHLAAATGPTCPIELAT